MYENALFKFGLRYMGWVKVSSVYRGWMACITFSCVCSMWAELSFDWSRWDDWLVPLYVWLMAYMGWMAFATFGLAYMGWVKFGLVFMGWMACAMLCLVWPSWAEWLMLCYVWFGLHGLSGLIVLLKVWFSLHGMSGSVQDRLCEMCLSFLWPSQNWKYICVCGCVC